MRALVLRTAGRPRLEEAPVPDGGTVDVVLDPVCGALLEAALTAVRQGGRVVSIGESAGPTARAPFAALRGRSLLTYSNQFTPAGLERAACTRLIGHLRTGELRPKLVVAP